MISDIVDQLRALYSEAEARERALLTPKVADAIWEGLACSVDAGYVNKKRGIIDTGMGDVDMDNVADAVVDVFFEYLHDYFKREVDDE